MDRDLVVRYKSSDGDTIKVESGVCFGTDFDSVMDLAEYNDTGNASMAYGGEFTGVYSGENIAGRYYGNRHTLIRTNLGDFKKTLVELAENNADLDELLSNIERWLEVRDEEVGESKLLKLRDFHL